MLGLKNTGTQYLLKILLSFSNTPVMYGMTMLLLLFFFSSPFTVLVFFLDLVAVFHKTSKGPDVRDMMSTELAPKLTASVHLLTYY